VILLKLVIVLSSFWLECVVTFAVCPCFLPAREGSKAYAIQSTQRVSP